MSIIYKISKELNISESFIKLVSKRSKHYYRHYTIPKTGGGKRDIHHPSPVLKTFQYWLVENIFNILPISEYAMAYKKGASIKKNASFHLYNTHILHTDIENFFPSINEGHIKELLMSKKSLINEKLQFEINDDDIQFIMNIALLKGKLTIGSVSSPIISNVVMDPVDRDIAKIANKYNCVFTRYADDIILSSNNFLQKGIIDEIENILNKKYFNINKNKTYFLSPKSKRIVTGIILNTGRLTIGRKKRDYIKKLVYEYCKDGTGNINVIRGYLSFLKDIDPLCYGNIIVKYQKYGDIDDLLIGEKNND